MDEKRLKESWHNISDRSDREQLMKEAFRYGLHTADRRTALSQLENRYMRFVILGCVMAVVSPIWVEKISMFAGNLKPLLGALCVIYFGCCAISAAYLRKKIREIDVLVMPTAEVTMLSTKCRRRHLKNILLLLPMALVILGMTGWIFRGESAVVYGLIAGGIFGLGMGTVILRRFLEDYRRVSDLSDDEEA